MNYRHLIVVVLILFSLGALVIPTVYAEDRPLDANQWVMKYTYLYYDRVLPEQAPSDNPISPLHEEAEAAWAEVVTGVRPGSAEAQRCGFCAYVGDLLDAA